MSKNIFSRIQAIITNYIKYTSKNPQWFLMFVLARFNLVRNTFHSKSQKLSPEKFQKSAFISAEVDVDIAVNCLQQNGYYLGLYLPEDILKEIIDFAYLAKMNVRDEPTINFVYQDKQQTEINYQKDIIIGNYVDVSSHCSAIRKIENEPTLWKIAEKYLGAKPILVKTELWWSFVADKKLYDNLSHSPTMFHYDLDDYRALKFFFYLTNVNLSSGAHVCITGSHNKKKLAHQFSFLRGRSDQEIINYYGTENIVNICGNAGFGFAEDPFCFHKGTPPRSSDRLMLQLEFALNDYFLKD